MFEYKVVPAPQRAVKVKGLKTTADRFAHALAERINAEAAGGWEFLRTETMACEERSGLGRVRSSTQTMMIFARALGQARSGAGVAMTAMQDDPSGSVAYPDAQPAATATAHPDTGWAAQDAEWQHHQDEVHHGTHGEWDAPTTPQAEPPIVEPQPAATRRQEPLFRSGARLHDDRAGRAEPVVRAPRADRLPDGE